MNKIGYNQIQYSVLVFINAIGILVLVINLRFENIPIYGFIALIISSGLFTLKKYYTIRDRKLIEFKSFFLIPYHEYMHLDNIVGVQIDKRTVQLLYRQYSPKGSNITGSTENEAFILYAIFENGEKKELEKKENLYQIINLGRFISEQLLIPLERRVLKTISKEYGIGPSSDHDEINKVKIVELFYEEVNFDQYKTLKRKKRKSKSILN